MNKYMNNHTNLCAVQTMFMTLFSLIMLNQTLIRFNTLKTAAKYQFTGVLTVQLPGQQCNAIYLL